MRALGEKTCRLVSVIVACCANAELMPTGRGIYNLTSKRLFMDCSVYLLILMFITERGRIQRVSLFISPPRYSCYQVRMGLPLKYCKSGLVARFIDGKFAA